MGAAEKHLVLETDIHKALKTEKGLTGLSIKESVMRQFHLIPRWASEMKPSSLTGKRVCQRLRKTIPVSACACPFMDKTML